MSFVCLICYRYGDAAQMPLCDLKFELQHGKAGKIECKHLSYSLHDAFIVNLILVIYKYPTLYLIAWIYPIYSFDWSGNVMDTGVKNIAKGTIRCK